MGLALRDAKATRFLPLVFVGGDPDRPVIVGALPNHTKLLKGFILKQDYELAKLDYDLAIATDAPDAEDRQTMLWAAKKAFCDFMAQVPTYAD